MLKTEYDRLMNYESSQEEYEDANAVYMAFNSIFCSKEEFAKWNATLDDEKFCNFAKEAYRILDMESQLRLLKNQKRRLIATTIKAELLPVSEDFYHVFKIDLKRVEENVMSMSKETLEQFVEVLVLYKSTMHGHHSNSLDTVRAILKEEV